MNPYGGMGAMGGAEPPYTSLSQGLYSPPKGGAGVSENPFGCLWGQTRKGNPSGVFPGVNPPQDGPPNLGIARDLLGVFL